MGKYVLSGVVNKQNKEKNSMIERASATAIKHKTGKLKHNYLQGEVLPEDQFQRFFFQSREKHGDQKQRVTDLNWSNNTFKLNWIRKEPDNQVMHPLKDGPEDAFVLKELMLLPEDTELPPVYVKN